MKTRTSLWSKIILQKWHMTRWSLTTHGSVHLFINDVQASHEILDHPIFVQLYPVFQLLLFLGYLLLGRHSQQYPRHSNDSYLYQIHQFGSIFGEQMIKMFFSWLINSNSKSRNFIGASDTSRFFFFETILSIRLDDFVKVQQHVWFFSIYWRTS